MLCVHWECPCPLSSQLTINVVLLSAMLADIEPRLAVAFVRMSPIVAGD